MIRTRREHPTFHLALACVVLLAFLPADSRPQAAALAKAVTAAKTAKFLRTDLVFGRSIPGGGLVSDEDWDAFLRETVTPRFPDGFTVLDGRGQYREKNGKIVSERSELLIILYSPERKKESRAKIEEIRTAYVQKFRQESVMRVDLPNGVRVSF